MAADKGCENLKSRFIKIMQARIFSGELRPGDKLPPERELAESLDMSRSSVNQGILDLERMGLLRIAPRKGTFVADYIHNATPQTLSAIMSYDSELVDVHLFRDLMKLRTLVECECAALAAENIQAVGAEQLRGKLAAVFDAHGDAVAQAMYEYHELISVMSGNSAYTMVFRSFERLIKKLMAAHYSNPREIENSLALYTALTNSIRNGNAERAKENMRAVLQCASEYLDSRLAE